jgi:hypothetical protein
MLGARDIRHRRNVGKQDIHELGMKPGIPEM